MAIKPLCQALKYDLLQYLLTLFRMGAGEGGGSGKKQSLSYPFFSCNFYKCRK